jgi:hypothetical protein
MIYFPVIFLFVYVTGLRNNQWYSPCCINWFVPNIIRQSVSFRNSITCVCSSRIFGCRWYKISIPSPTKPNFSHYESIYLLMATEIGYTVLSRSSNTARITQCVWSIHCCWIIFGRNKARICLSVSYAGCSSVCHCTQVSWVSTKKEGMDWRLDI